MKKSYGIFLIIFIFLVSACSSQPSPENIQTSWSEEDLTGFVSNMGQDIGTLLSKGSTSLTVLTAIPQNAPIPNLSMLAVSSLNNPETLLHDLSMLSFVRPFAAGLSETTLARGVYRYTPGGNWELTQDSADLVLLFPLQNPDFSTSTAKITFDWDAAAPTLKVRSAGGSSEVPSDMRILASIDGMPVGKVSLAVTWYQSDCAYRTLEPASLKLEAELDGGNNERLGFSLSFSSESTAKNVIYQLDGSVKLQIAEDYGKLSFQSKLNTSVSRDKNCFLTDIRLNKGNVGAKLETKIQDEQHSLGISFGFDNPVVSIDSFSMDIFKGEIKADGQTVVSFAGRLDDSNGNSIPGENLLIEFDDGSSTSLEVILASL